MVDHDRTKIIRETETATGAVRFVTNKGTAKARGRAHRYPSSTVQRFVDEYNASQSGFVYTVEEA